MGLEEFVSKPGNIVNKIAAEAAQQPFDSSLEFKRDNVFLLYASFCGDAERTAYASSLSVDEVRTMAEAEGWNARLRGILELRKSQKPGEVERAINRALNFVQAHRMRLILEATIRRITAMTPEELERATTHKTFDRDGLVVSETLSTRPLADLTAALEKCHSLTYQALSDTATDRKARPELASDEESSGEIHARIAAAFSKPLP